MTLGSFFSPTVTGLVLNLSVLGGGFPRLCACPGVLWGSNAALSHLDASSGLILKGVPCCTQRQTNFNATFQFLSCSAMHSTPSAGAVHPAGTGATDSVGSGAAYTWPADKTSLPLPPRAKRGSGNFFNAALKLPQNELETMPRKAFRSSTLIFGSHTTNTLPTLGIQMVHLEVVNKNSSCTLPLPLALQALLQLAPQTRQKTYRSCSSATGAGAARAAAAGATVKADNVQEMCSATGAGAGTLLVLAPRARQTMREALHHWRWRCAHSECWHHRHADTAIAAGAGAMYPLMTLVLLTVDL